MKRKSQNFDNYNMGFKVLWEPQGLQLSPIRVQRFRMTINFRDNPEIAQGFHFGTLSENYIFIGISFHVLNHIYTSGHPWNAPQRSPIPGNPHHLPQINLTASALHWQPPPIAIASQTSAQRNVHFRRKSKDGNRISGFASGQRVDWSSRLHGW